MAALNLVMFGVLWAMGTATIQWDAILINDSRPFPNRTEIKLPANQTYIYTICPPGTGNVTARCSDKNGEAFQGLRNDTGNHYVATCDPWTGLVCNIDAKYNTTAKVTCPDFYLQYGCDRPDSGSTNYTRTTPTASSKGGNGNAVSITHGTVVSSTSTLPNRLPGGGSAPVLSGNGTGMATAHATSLSTGSTQSNSPPGGSLGRRSTIDWDNRLLNNNRPFPNGTEIELTPSAAFIDTVCPPGSGNITLKCHNVKGGVFQGSKNDTDNHLVITCDPLKGLVCNPDTNATMNATCPDFYLQYGCDKPDSGRTNYTKTTPLTSTTSTSVPSGNGTGMSAAHATYLSTGSTKFTPPPGGSLGKHCTCNGGNHVVINKKLVSLITIVCLIKRLVY